MNKLHYHVISNTHWDREWRYPFQVYRMELVKMMDRLLSILENRPEYRAFFLDSQTVVIEDYLEIRPEMEDRLRAMVQNDRLQIGPWYTLPDQWCCPGEALVRNLLMGKKVGSRFGPVSRIGYTPFSNGQISQLPQIYNGFGIDNVFFYRGIGKHVAPPEFIWEGPDGSRLLSFRFGDYARYNYYYLVYRPGLLGRFLDERDYKWNPEEIPYRVAGQCFQDRQYGWMNRKLSVHPENLERALSEARSNTEPDTNTPHLLYMMGHDHSFPSEEELDLIEACRDRLDPEREKILHSSLADYLEAFRKEAKNLELLKGEMRHTNKEGLWTNLMAEILSTRLYLKQENARVNNKVLYGSEPLAAMAFLAGTPYPAPFFKLAWKKILVNQAHDAVGGCSVDPVHTEMEARWSEVEALSDEICRNSMRDLASRIDASSISPEHLQLTVFNTLPFPRSELCRFIVDLPTQNPNESFSLETLEGSPVPCQLLSRETYTPTIEGPLELSMPFQVQRFHVACLMGDLPELGYRVFRIKPGGSLLESGEGIVKSERELENEFLKVRVNDNGTLRITDKQNGRVMDNLCFFEDEAEFGDPWNRVDPAKDSPILSLDCNATFRIIHEGPLEGTIRIEIRFPVPAEKGPDGMRSIRVVELPVSMDLTLRKNSPLLEVNVSLDNRARDHRLRVIFPSGIKEAKHSFAGGQFDVLRRPIRLPGSEGWKEPPYPTHPMWDFVDVSDGQNGLAVISSGLIEYEVKDDPERSIAVTLVRAFGKFVFGRPTPGSQCPGLQKYRFTLYPHAGFWSDADILREKSRHIAPLQALESAPTKGDLPPEGSFLRVSPPSVAFSGIKESEDGEGLVVRLWNPLEEALDLVVKAGFPIKEARLLSLEETALEVLEPGGDGALHFPAPPKKIITLGIKLGSSTIP